MKYKYNKMATNIVSGDSWASTLQRGLPCDYVNDVRRTRFQNFVSWWKIEVCEGLWGNDEVRIILAAVAICVLKIALQILFEICELYLILSRQYL